MLCEKCGYELKGEELFCPKCGEKIIQPKEETEKFKSSEEFFRRKLGERKKEKSSYSIEPEISEKILINAANKIAGGISPAKIIAVYDTTVFSSGKEGVVFTGSCIYIKAMLVDIIKIPLEKIKDVKYVDELKTDSNGKEIKNTYFKIIYENSDEIEVNHKDFIDSEFEYIYKLIKGFHESVESVEDKNYRYNSLAELGEGIICAYLRIIVSYLKSDDGIIDSKEYKELIALMARIRVPKELVQKLRNERLNIEKNEENFTDLVESLNNELKLKSLDSRSIYQSLFKDLLVVKGEDIENWKNDSVLYGIKMLLQLDEKQIDVLIKSINADKRIVEERLMDNQVKEITKELVAVAGGAGVTLAALAVTGGVASGIWGGLLTLGLMSTGGMLLGLAAIGGMGYGAYRGIKYFSGTSELEKSGIRIAALQSSIESNKLAVTYIVEDVNWLINKISELFSKIHESEDLNDKLFTELSQYIEYANLVGDSGALLEKNVEKEKYEIYIAKLPLDLPYDRFKELVNMNSGKEEIENFVFSIYIKKEITECEDSENTYTKIVYRRDEELTYEDAEKMYNYFSLIGLYDTKSSALAQGKAITKKSFNAIKSIFGEL